MKTSVFSSAGLLLFLFFFFLPRSVLAAEEENSRIVRIGWYDYPGFYMTDKNGYRSGYAYDYFQELARYTGWKYEYIHSTAAEAMEMLTDGRIDLLPAVMHSPDRDKVLLFSEINSGKNFSVLTKLTSNPRFQLGNYADFDGIRIGALSGDIRLSELQKHAEKNNYTYRLTMYPTVAEMEEALAEKEIDSILATSMRIAKDDELVIAQFAPIEFYFVTWKGNDAVMDELNAAMEQIEFKHKDFPAELSQKYFSVDMSGSLSFTEEEKKFIAQNPVIRVAFLINREPLSFFENGEYGGIIAAILNEISGRLGIVFECVAVKSPEEGIELLDGGSVKMITSVFNDYGYADKKNMVLSRPYLMLNYASIARVGENLNRPDLKVAAVSSYHFSEKYVAQHFNKDQITWYDSDLECIEAVRQGKQDVCYVNYFTSNKYLFQRRYRNLFFSMISYSHGISAGVSAGNSTILLSLIDKAIASMGKNTVNFIIDETVKLNGPSFSFGELIFYYPVQFIVLFSSVGLVIIGSCALVILFRYRRRKNSELYRARHAAERDSLTGLFNRIAYEVIVTQKLQEMRSLSRPDGAFLMMDIDNFKQVNDKSGHTHGDFVLKKFAQDLHSLFSQKNVVLCRMGGDEFSAFFPETHKESDFAAFLNTARRKLTQNYGENSEISCSMGFAAVSEQLSDFSSLYEAADKALYCAKHHGKGCVCSIDDAKKERLLLRRKSDTTKG